MIKIKKDFQTSDEIRQEACKFAAYAVIKDFCDNIYNDYDENNVNDIDYEDIDSFMEIIDRICMTFDGIETSTNDEEDDQCVD